MTDLPPVCRPPIRYTRGAEHVLRSPDGVPVLALRADNHWFVDALAAPGRILKLTDEGAAAAGFSYIGTLHQNRGLIRRHARLNNSTSPTACRPTRGTGRSTGHVLVNDRGEYIKAHYVYRDWIVMLPDGPQHMTQDQAGAAGWRHFGCLPECGWVFAEGGRKKAEKLRDAARGKVPWRKQALERETRLNAHMAHLLVPAQEQPPTVDHTPRERHDVVVGQMLEMLMRAVPDPAEQMAVVESVAVGAFATWPHRPMGHLQVVSEMASRIYERFEAKSKDLAARADEIAKQLAS